MILIGYIILGHSDWKKGKIKIYVAFHQKHREDQYKKLKELIVIGRLPISLNNIESIMYSDAKNLKEQVLHNSTKADMTILGFNDEHIINNRISYFKDFPNMCNILFMNAFKKIEII